MFRWVSCSHTLPINLTNLRLSTQHLLHLNSLTTLLITKQINVAPTADTTRGSPFIHPCDLDLWPLTLKLLCHLLLTWLNSLLSLNVLWFSVSRLTFGTAQTDGQTDRVQRVMRLLRGDCCKNHLAVKIKTIHCQQVPRLRRKQFILVEYWPVVCKRCEIDVSYQQSDWQTEGRSQAGVLVRQRCWLSWWMSSYAAAAQGWLCHLDTSPPSPSPFIIIIIIIILLLFYCWCFNYC